MLAWLVIGGQRPSEAQSGFTFARGQSISPVYEGWQRNTDGSYTLWFGYINRNWEERPHLPIGSQNVFTPGDADRGQPDFFQPRLNRFAFSVRVPASYKEESAAGGELVWTLTVGGETNQAFASLRPGYVLEDLTIMDQRGAFGGGGPPASWKGNDAPKVAVNASSIKRVRVGEPLLLAAQVTDDGVPTSRSKKQLPMTAEGDLDLRRALRQPSSHVLQGTNQLTFSWFVYRGDGDQVSFDPSQVKVWRDTRPYASKYSELGVVPEPPDDHLWIARATFKVPGTYTIRGRGDDGGLFTDRDVSVVVTP